MYSELKGFHYVWGLLILVILAGCSTGKIYLEGDSGDSVDVDGDGDGWPAGKDCDDSDASVNPDASEICDGIDNNCNGEIDEGVKNIWYADQDGDLYGTEDDSVEACGEPEGYVADLGDCDDFDPDVNPDAIETCNGTDDNCDGNIDEGLIQTWYADMDGDGFGDEYNSMDACVQPMGYVSQDTDCDDTNPDISPGAIEICDGGIDNDCDGRVDDDDVGSASGNVDPSTYTTWYADMDGDGFGGATTTQDACEAPTGYVGNQTDCDDSDADINPGEAEICDDGVDNDCNPSNDTMGSNWYADADGDGYGNPADYYSSCSAPSGRVLDSTDCDDTNPDVNPDATETCNSVDDDCNGVVDDGATDGTNYYFDGDGDGYGDASISVESCSAPSGYVLDSTDCDDTRSGVNPGAYEYCSTTYDDDCDGSINEASAVDVTTWYDDADADGYGDASVSAVACTAPTGYVSASGDCDDSDASVGPGSPETCNGIDDDCDGSVDEEATDATTWYTDNDSDGYGDPADSLDDCDEPTGYVDNSDDCDDTSADAYPGGPVEFDFVLDPTSIDYLTEVDYCNDGLDNDCNGDVDSADWACMDHDGDGIENGADPYVTNGTDLCAVSENLYEPDWSGSTVYVQSSGSLSSLSTGTGVTLTNITIDGISVDAWCITPSGTGYDYGWFVSSVGADGSTSVATSNCADWVRPVEEVCNTYADGFCAASGNSDGCHTVGNTGYGYYFSGSTTSPY